MDNNKSLVSVIVPCYNYAHFLGEALDSVMAQTYPYWECIIVNDGSPDNTEEIALEYCKKDSRFKYLYKENGGHSSARNMAIKNSTGKYILPLDADDKITNEYLARAVEMLDNRSQVTLVTGQVMTFGSENEKIEMGKYDFRRLLIINYLCITSMYRKEDYSTINGYDETMEGFEDWDFFIRLLKKGGTVIELPIVTLWYRKKKDSMYQSVLKDSGKCLRDLLKLYLNNKDAYLDFFDSPIGLIQENEKMKKIIKSYQKTMTYKFGIVLNRIKCIFK